MNQSPIAGKPAPDSILVNVPKLIEAYYLQAPDPESFSERVSFGTSGHRGSSFTKSFNEQHILAITQSICDWRRENLVGGPLFIGKDTHALSEPAMASALEVLAANEIVVMVAKDDEYTPTPAISHAILCHNRQRSSSLADGIVITPSHNPPETGGFKYNPPSGGPADKEITCWIEQRANHLLKTGLAEVKRIPLERALKASTTKRYDYLNSYVADLDSVIDLEVIKREKIRLAIDPLGGAGVHYWQAIAERFSLDLTVVSEEVDPTFRFMTVDFDGQIRMDPSSPFAMRRLIALKDKFQIACACDTDHDRHGIVSSSFGLIPPNHYLAASILYLFANRPRWGSKASIGKTVVSSKMINFAAKKIHRDLYEVPVGFKWFVNGLLKGSLGFVGEESAGASFLRKDGTVWTTDKDGITASLLAAEILARTGKDPSMLYQELTSEFGVSFYDRVEAPATKSQKELLKNLSASQVHLKDLAGEAIESVMSKAPGNGASFDGLKVATQNGWFAARPSGTEDLYKIYAESFLGKEHLSNILQEAQVIVDKEIKS